MAELHKQRLQYEARRGALEMERSTWVSHWRACGQYIQPRRAQFLDAAQTTSTGSGTTTSTSTRGRNVGKKRHSAIINSAATRAADTLTAGLMAGLTSPARPWFRITTPVPGLAEFGPVKQWMHLAEVILYEMFRRSNFYQSLAVVYEDLGVFGTAAMMIEADFQDVIRCTPFPVGSYSLALDGRLAVDTIYRKEEMTASQLISAFGEDNVSDSLVRSWKKDATEETADIVHVIELNDDRIEGKRDFRNMPFRSVYYDAGDTDHEFLRESGFSSFPVIAPRWWVTGRDVYGRSPGMNALGDVRALQEDERRKGKHLEMLTRPPMVAPQSMKRARVSTVPGEVSYVPDSAARDAYRPAWLVDPNISPQLENIDATTQRIEECFHKQAILALLFNRSPQKTATEVAEIAGEKAVVLSVAIERTQHEGLDPAVLRSMEIALQSRVIPPPPPELVGAPIAFDYVSILAQAQKAIGTVGIERISGTVGSWAAVNPTVLDKLDFDQMVDEYGSLLHVPPQIIRSDDQVAQIRQQRQQAEQQQQALELAERGVQGAKVLSETEVGGQNALDQLLGGGV